MSISTIINFGMQCEDISGLSVVVGVVAVVGRMLWTMLEISQPGHGSMM